MTQGEAIAGALASLSLGMSLWVLWRQRRLRAELDAAWAELDGLIEAARAVR